MKKSFIEKHYSDATGKLHMPCPYREQTGLRVHVVIRDGFCYRSKDCLVVRCKYNRLQTDIQCLLSLTW
ncbi:MAG: hypothetical protein M1497_05435 [Nitrospirae bacterium]|nr:hypothetical protein [Nitrospirota bacterium]